MRSEPSRSRVGMATLALVVGATAAALSTGCEATDPWNQASCPPGGTPLTYENFGKTFFTAYCNQCHGKHVVDRFGAPEGFYFDDRDEIANLSEHIYERSARENDSMPPGPDDPPIEKRDELGEWLACGAP